MKSYYKYEAYDEKRQFYQAKIIATSEKDAYQKLSVMGLYVASLKRERGWQTLLFSMQYKLPEQELIFFFRQLAFALKSGISLIEAMKLQAEEIQHKNMQQFNTEIISFLSRGFSFSESIRLSTYDLPELVKEWLLLGEVEGKLDNILGDIADYLEKETAFKRDLKGQLAYPILLFGLLSVFFFLLAFYFVPMLEEAYREFGIAIPKSLALLLMVTKGIKNMKWLILLFVCLSVVILKRDYKRIRTRLRQYFSSLLERIPSLALLRNLYYFIPFSRSLSILLDSGVSAVVAFSILESSGKNPNYLKVIRKAKEKVLSGEGMMKAFENAFFIPKSSYQMLLLAEKSGKLSEALIFLSNYYEKLQRQKLRMLIKLVEPAMIIILGLAVLFLAVAFYVPIIDSYENFFKV
jgi:type II secretory pathway, component pulF